MAQDLKEMFPHEYEAYRRFIERPLQGEQIKDRYLGDEGFPNWLHDIFEAQRRMDERDPGGT